MVVRPLRVFLAARGHVITFPAAAIAQGGRTGGEAASQGGSRGSSDVHLARGKTRDIDFTTNVGTWTSVDLSPDGSWIAFDLIHPAA